MREELFGPILTVYVYNDLSSHEDWIDLLNLVDQTSQYGLTGSVFANDRRAIVDAEHVLRHAAGNFYINDKCTGAVVGEQPFGGSRNSGTNDKAGSQLNLLRWTTPMSVKESYIPLYSYSYPHMAT